MGVDMPSSATSERLMTVVSLGNRICQREQGSDRLATVLLVPEFTKEPHRDQALSGKEGLLLKLWRACSTRPQSAPTILLLSDLLFLQLLL